MFGDKVTNVWSKPGAHFSHMHELVDDLTILHHDDMPKSSRNHFYISCGICDLTTRNRGHKYEEVVFHSLGEGERADLHKIIEDVAKHTRNQYGLPIFCTVYPMSLREWNATLLRTRKTDTLKFKDSYANMQQLLERELEQLNDSLININLSNGVTTPMLHKNIIHNRGNSQIKYRYNTLSDGCHPSASLINKCRKSLNQAIVKNRKV